MLADAEVAGIDCGSAYDCLNFVRSTYAPFSEFR